jgi:hypothetical protein
MTIDIKEGRYTANVVCWGFTYRDTKNGRQNQFAIEFDIDADGAEYAPTRFTHFIGIDNDKGLEILDKQLATCGWKGGDYGSIELDTATKVSVKVEVDDYGPKIKYIDPLDGGPGGGLIARKKLGGNEEAAVIARLNARAKTAPPAGAQRSAPTASAASRPTAPRTAAPAASRPPAPKPAAPKAAPADTNSDWGFEGDGANGGGGIPF